MGVHFIKQCAPFLDGGRYLQSLNQSVIGGGVATVPSAVGASQGEQNIPGDIFAIDTDTAKALSDTVNYTTLYGGWYQFVKIATGTTAAPTYGHVAFWDTSVADDLYQVTPDESGAMGASNIAGFYINTPTKGNYALIQIGGKCSALFRTVLTGVPLAGAACIVAGAGAGTDVGTLDTYAQDANAPTFADMDLFLNRYVGPAIALPVAAAISTVQIKYPFFKRL